MVRKIVLILFPLLIVADIVCQQENERITCTYFIQRSDNAHGLTVEFHWYSPKGDDDRIKRFKVPPFYGSVYDYRFVPGREEGRWRVVVRELETNKSATTFFDLNGSSEEFFAD
ncbi:hypothetical protein [Nitratiruptor tergarcus]|uniref:DUF2914 domain-containing protein n=1 Tax=Nitratiruptor tergarcus DSM 16512 TaxID=1069081 RepID=A0A1W1WQY7_9BACT|nr:hypothetical protein [Nitratiruptor tergarcus]SMC08656.1 hypothetical protein SAMN05660197_0420 [Nitratiruptor tergarcus DSM 16512]